jgi:hypothetical protein
VEGTSFDKAQCKFNKAFPKAYKKQPAPPPNESKKVLFFFFWAQNNTKPRVSQMYVLFGVRLTTLRSGDMHAGRYSLGGEGPLGRTCLTFDPTREERSKTITHLSQTNTKAVSAKTGLSSGDQAPEGARGARGCISSHFARGVVRDRYAREGCFPAMLACFWLKAAPLAASELNLYTVHTLVCKCARGSLA